MAKLTTKQKRFCDEYLRCFNATQSAINAGYSQRSARQIATGNMSKKAIQDYISAKMAKDDQKLVADQNEVLSFLTSVIRGEITQQVVSSSGNVVEIMPTVADRLRASEIILRAWGAFRQQLSITAEQQIIVIDGYDQIKE